MQKFTKVFYNIPKNKIVTLKLIKAFLNKFWNEVVINLPQNTHIILITKIKYSNKMISIGRVTSLNKNDRDFYYTILESYLLTKDQEYYQEQGSQIIFNYKIVDGIAPNNSIGKPIPLDQKYYNHNLPLSFNPSDFGIITHQSNNTYNVWVDNNFSAIITKKNENNALINEVKWFNRKNPLPIFTWKDTFISTNSFKRELGQSIYIIEKGVIVVTLVKSSAKPIKQLIKNLKNIKNNNNNRYII